MQFSKKLGLRVQEAGSLLCVGLDPVPDKIPPQFGQGVGAIHEFLTGVIGATRDFAAAYKPNLAYFECLGSLGMKLFETILQEIPAEIPVIADAKRADVGHSASMYAKALFDTYGCDAATVNPYLGRDSVEAFLEYEQQGVFILCLTSNPGAEDFQLPELHLEVARKVRKWNRNRNAGLVVGATHPEHVGAIRTVSGPMPFLIPGVGPQGGQLKDTLNGAEDGTRIPFLVNASRGILYASGGNDCLEESRKAARELKERINAIHADS